VNVTKQLAMALSDVLQSYPGSCDSLHQRGREALDAYKASDEYKREQFDEQLRGASKAANELTDVLEELCSVPDWSDGDSILLGNAKNLVAEAADYLNTIIEGTTP
jgi:hypothetical protein